ncbi:MULTISPECIES: hypothetical protein [Streptomyces]|uniref:hypothetical protein n=1 Tax=Streptomyces TaxID=1883 RepID=UPI001672C1FA|nr:MULTISPECIES: hypothetical protein [Streptomyces]MBD3579575.1 hypothetical protein [Streptomyces sp. KD18]GGS89840.1 hypothetical protein GCM10010286_13140 [Streptomyces toxytricini]
MRKKLSRLTAAVVCTVLLAACGSGGADEKAARVCEAASTSEEALLLREILQTEAVVADPPRTMDELVRKLKRDLRSLPPHTDTARYIGCTFETNSDVRHARVNFSFSWMPRAAPLNLLIGGGVEYDVNGVRVAADSVHARMYVPCAMPADLADHSQKADLHVVVSSNFMDFAPDRSQAGREKTAALTYLVTRNVTDALGCENKPLEQPPTVKPLPDPTP